jgi:molecular chaperone HtpG
MNNDNGIEFQVETSRVLQLLSREIYDSPLAIVRENLQNAYDAIRMRFASSGELTDGGRIDIGVENGEISITDNGVGMNEEVLRENFWKAGSSGKHSEAARKSGVVGTFGIGAMANFGVASRLMIETRAVGSVESLRSMAARDEIKIGQKCISFENITSDRDFGTTVTAVLDENHPINRDQVFQYLQPYVSLLPVPVYLNGELISQNSIESQLPISGRTFTELGITTLNDSFYGGTFKVQVDHNGQVFVDVSEITLGETSVDGRIVFVQAGGPLMGYRSLFGLAPIPVSGCFQFGGIANLSFLLPTAGREALSRESIDHVNRFMGLAERAASELIANAPEADKNNSFLQWVISHNRYELTDRVTIEVLPEGKQVSLSELVSYIGDRTKHYYTGNEPQILATFSNAEAYLLRIAQSNPRKTVQINYVVNRLQIPEVPDSAQVTKTYTGPELTMPEASILIKIGFILREDYLLPDTEPIFADITHGVTLLPSNSGDRLKIYISKSCNLIPPLLEFHGKAYDLFMQFMKDFVRVNIYPKIQQFVPSSTRNGVEALRKLLERNRELYRYEETDSGDVEGLLGDYLSGEVNLTAVLNSARQKVAPQTQRVSQDQVGSIETEVPGVTDSPVIPTPEGDVEFDARPPIIRMSAISDMKILTTCGQYPTLNNFTMFLGLSDRFMKSEAEFLHTPHTTRILWGGHRVVYIFTDASGSLSLYYDIEFRNPIERTKAGGCSLPTTTLITSKRIYIPIPEILVEEFRVTTGPKEFYVRHDILYNSAT